MWDPETFAFRGPAYYDGDAYQKLDIEDEEDRLVFPAGHRRLGRGAAASLRRGHRAGGEPGVPVRAARRGHGLPAARRRPRARRAGGRQRRVRRDAVRRAEAAGAAEDGRPAARAHRRLRHADDPRAAAVQAAVLDLRLRRQLGLDDHHRHVPDQARLLQAVRDERPFDGEDEDDRAAAQDAAGAPQGRPPGAGRGDDEPVQDREDQPGRRLPADPGADPVLPRVLLGAARERRDAPGAVHGLDPGPVLARPVLRAAGADGRRDVRRSTS